MGFGGTISGCHGTPSGRQHELPAGGPGVPGPRDGRCPREHGTAGPAAGLTVGTGQHREVRGEPGQGDHFRKKCRSSQCPLPPPVPLQQWSVPARHSTERSGLLQLALTPRDVAMARGRALGSALGCRQPEVQDMVACLQSRSAEDIVNNQPQALLDFGFTPVVDGNFLPSHPSDMAEERPPPTVDVMAGFTTNEGSLFIARETSLGFNRSTDSFINKNQYIKTIQALLPTLNEFGIDAVAFEYTDWRGLDNPAVYRDAAENMVGDYSFKCPVIEASLARARVGGKVYMYQFNHVVSNLPPSSWTGAMHSSASSLVFGLPLNPSENFTQDEDRLSRKMMRFWTNFAMTGDPNDPGTETWPPYNQTDQSYIVLDTQPVRVAQWPRTGPCAFWREYLWQLQEQTDASSATTTLPAILLLLSSVTGLLLFA
ncbi:acetylcholinesterase-like isoform X2 [Branchiostoma floridae x Branchiostoma belcheri]